MMGATSRAETAYPS